MKAVIAPVVVQSASTKPENRHRESAAGLLLELAQAVAEQLGGLGWGDGSELVQQRADRVGAGDKREHADRDQQRRRDREERVVGECRCQIGHLVVERLFARAFEDRHVVAP